MSILNLFNPGDTEWTNDTDEYGRPQIPIKITGRYGKRNKYGQQNSLVVEVTVEMWGRMLHAVGCLTDATGAGYDPESRPAVVGAWRWLQSQTEQGVK